jgi:putative DNA primase/helicase
MSTQPPGRKRAFYLGSVKPTVPPVAPERIPSALKARAQWVAWKLFLQKNQRGGENEWKKLLLNPATGRAAKTNDPGTWGTFEQALDYYRRHRTDGIGYVLSDDDPFVGIDLDDCLDPEANALSDEAQNLIVQFATYAEISPSRTGIKLFGIGVLPQGCKHHVDEIEVYDQLRWFAVTGQRLPGCPDEPLPCQPALDALLASKGFSKSTASAPSSNGQAVRSREHDRRVLMDRARAYLRKEPPAVSGQHGHDRAFHVAMILLEGFALTDDEARELISEWNATCIPRWNDREIEHKITSAKERIDVTRLGYLANGRAPQRRGNCRASSPDKPSTAPGAIAEPHLTDLGNGLRLVARHGEDLRYVRALRTWFAWDGKRWAQDETGEAERRAKDTVVAMYAEAGADFAAAAAMLKTCQEVQQKWHLQQQADAAARKLKHALASEGARRLRAILDVAWSESGISIPPEMLDRGLFSLNVNNGTLDLERGLLRPHRREDLLTKLAPVDYYPHATCPLWMHCLDRWMAGKRHLIEYLQRIVGYWLSADVSEQSFWIFHGGGANGKSTFILTVLAMMGDFGMQAVSDLLLQKRNEAHPTERADLFGRRFVATIETDQGKRIAEALMKQVTGGDRIRARKMFKDFFEFAPSHKIVMGVNHLPELRGTDHATWRRPKLVPWTVTIPEADKDKHLADKLKFELPGILAWAVRGFAEWQRSGMREPEEVRLATDNYRQQMDTVQGFLDACCAVGDRNFRVKVSALHEAYVEWSGDENMTQKAFGKIVQEKGYVTAPRVSAGVFWIGIALQQ